MCVFKAPKVEQQEIPAVATEQDPAVLAARERERRRQAAARSGSTLLSGGQGVTKPSPSTTKSLLGE